MLKRYLVFLVLGVIGTAFILAPATAEGQPYRVRLTISSGEHTFHADSCRFTGDGQSVKWKFTNPIWLEPGQPPWSGISPPLPWIPTDFHMFYNLDTFPKRIDIDPIEYGAWYELCSNPVPAEMMLEQVSQIPTLTEWGLIIFGVVLLGFVTWVFLRRKRVVGVRI